MLAVAWGESVILQRHLESDAANLLAPSVGKPTDATLYPHPNPNPNPHPHPNPHPNPNPSPNANPNANPNPNPNPNPDPGPNTRQAERRQPRGGAA